MTSTTTLHAAALAFHNADLCIVPARPDGSKAPAGAWKRYQSTRPDREQLAAWFAASNFDGLGAITGAISGNLEMLELEGRAADEGITIAMRDRAHELGLGELWTTVTAGYLEFTPTGGIHLLYHVTEPVGPNTKLASRPATASELADNPGDRIKVLIETRGEGGFTILAPSGGRTHPTGNAWQCVQGGPGTIATITGEQRDDLHRLARTFDAMPTGEPDTEPPSGTAPPRAQGDPLRPGDDYNTRATWAEVLDGWKQVYTSAGVTYWRRPGKTTGISATTGRDDKDNLYVFTTSTDFQAETPYSKFGAYTLLRHGGDWGKAAKALAADGYGEPRTPPTTQVFTPLPTPDPDPVTVASLTESDDGTALALINTYGSIIRYCHDRGRWLAWDTSRWVWQPRDGGIVREHVKTIARNLPNNPKPALAHKRRALSAQGTTSALAQAATDTRISISYSQLDAHPWELNTPGGIVDLRTGVLHPPDPAKLHTRSTPCTPNPNADPTTWHAFLADTFGADTSLIGYTQRLLGYSATGHVGAHVLPFAHGSGGNGKGVFLEAALAVLGDYALTAPVGFLMAQANSGHETEIARLAGARMVLCSEVNDGDRFDEAKVKQLTGGDTLAARFMRQDHFTFTPSHHLWLMGNSQPTVRTGGRSFWRRLRLLPFLHEVPDDKIVDDLQGILARDHGPALLAWIVAGAAAYATGGLQEPATVLAATASYAADQDTVARFLDDAAIIGGGPHVKVRISDVRAAYERWCQSLGETPVTAKAFSLALNRVGCPTVRVGKSRARHHENLTLISGDEDGETGRF